MHAVAAALLGHVAGGVGVGQRGALAQARAVQHHHADAGADGVVALLPAEHVAVDLGAQGFGHRHRARLVGVAQQDGEFVAAQARHHPVGRKQARQQRGQLRQQLVAGVVAGGVVDQLELVEVHVQQRPVRAAVVELGDGPIEPALELAAVVQAGERIVAGLVAQLLAQHPQLGDVVGHGQQVRHLAQADRGHRQRGPERRLVGAAQQGRLAEDGVGGDGQRLHALAQGRVFDQFAKTHAGDVALDAEAITTGLVGIDEAGVVGPRQHHQGGQQLVQGAEALLALLELRGHLAGQRERAGARAGNRPGQQGQQQAGQHADAEGERRYPAGGVGHRQRRGLDAPGAASEGDVASEGRRRGGVLAFAEQRRAPAAGHVEHPDGETLARFTGQRVVDQAAHPEGGGQRPHFARASLGQVGRPCAGAEDRQADGDAVVRAGHAGALDQLERGRHHRPVGVAGEAGRGEVGRLGGDVQAQQHLVARQRGGQHGEVVVPAIGLRAGRRAVAAHRNGQRLEAGELLARPHVGVHGLELGDCHLVG